MKITNPYEYDIDTVFYVISSLKYIAFTWLNYWLSEEQADMQFEVEWDNKKMRNTISWNNYFKGLYMSKWRIYTRCFWWEQLIEQARPPYQWKEMEQLIKHFFWDKLPTDMKDKMIMIMALNFQ